MGCSEAIKQAREIIGEKSEQDYIISPSTHREIYKEVSPELYAILDSSQLESATRRYEHEDQLALEAQKKFNDVFKRTNRTILITSFIISGILALGVLASDTTAPPVSIILGVMGIGSLVTGALASRYFLLMKKGKLLETWMSKRADAETMRLEYFEKLIDQDVPNQSKTIHFTDLLKLEYFRRYQLKVQLDYYRLRSKDHKKDSERSLSMSGWAAAGSGVAAGIATFSFMGEILTAIAAFGVVFTAMSSYASVREGVYQYRRNSERYERTAKTLETLYERLDDVRQAVCKAGNIPLEEYVEAVHEQLSLEHRQWIGQLNESRGAYGRLEKTLNEVLSKDTANPSG